jgi:hypothetical protein
VFHRVCKAGKIIVEAELLGILNFKHSSDPLETYCNISAKLAIQKE